jgi:hypothetical protein
MGRPNSDHTFSSRHRSTGLWESVVKLTEITLSVWLGPGLRGVSKLGGAAGPGRRVRVKRITHGYDKWRMEFNGYAWLPWWMKSWIMQRYDGWISMYKINGYLFRLCLDIHGYVWIQQITNWICKWLEHGYTVWIWMYLRWRSHLNTHGYAKWNMDMNGYLDG